MNISDFTQQVQDAAQRASLLYQHAFQPSLSEFDSKDVHSAFHEGRKLENSLVLTKALEELQATLEELQVAEAELWQQNEELAIANHLLETERQRYQDLFEFAPDGYLITDAAGIIQEANRAAALLLNIAPQRLIGKPLSLFISPEDRRAFRDQLNRLCHPSSQNSPASTRRPGYSQEWEARLQPRQESTIQQSQQDATRTPTDRGRPTGATPRWNRLPALGEWPFDAALTVTAVRDPKGKLVGLRWLLRDITERKRAEEAIRQNERYELVLRGANDGFWDWDLDTNQLYFSYRWQAMLGYEEDEIGHSSDEWFNRVHAEDVELLKERSLTTSPDARLYWSTSTGCRPRTAPTAGCLAVGLPCATSRQGLPAQRVTDRYH